MKTSLKWLLYCYSWSGVALILGICNVSYARYGRYWWGVAVIFIIGLLISLIKELKEY